MKRILLAGGALAAMTLGSQAADLGYAPAAVDVWSGFFVGVQGGYGWGDADYAFLDAGTFDEANPSSFEIEGGLGGLYYGRNWQSGSFVYGLEGSISFGDLSDGTTFTTDGGFSVGGSPIVAGNDPVDFDVTIEAFTTSRAKIGYAAGDFLLFAAGGLSVARIEAELSGPLGSADDDDWAFGWTVGAGVETKFAENWSARVEYLYIDYGDETFFGGDEAEVDVELDAHIVRAGVAYHF